LPLGLPDSNTTAYITVEIARDQVVISHDGATLRALLLATIALMKDRFTTSPQRAAKTVSYHFMQLWDTAPAYPDETQSMADKDD